MMGAFQEGQSYHGLSYPCSNFDGLHKSWALLAQNPSNPNPTSYRSDWTALLKKTNEQFEKLICRRIELSSNEKSFLFEKAYYIVHLNQQVRRSYQKLKFQESSLVNLIGQLFSLASESSKVLDQQENRLNHLYGELTRDKIHPKIFENAEKIATYLLESAEELYQSILSDPDLSSPDVPLEKVSEDIPIYLNKLGELALQHPEGGQNSEQPNPIFLETVFSCEKGAAITNAEHSVKTYQENPLRSPPSSPNFSTKSFPNASTSSSSDASTSSSSPSERSAIQIKISKFLASRALSYEELLILKSSILASFQQQTPGPHIFDFYACQSSSPVAIPDIEPYSPWMSSPLELLSI